MSETATPPTTRTLYHGTCKKQWAAIQLEGLVPGKGHGAGPRSNSQRKRGYPRIMTTRQAKTYCILMVIAAWVAIYNLFLALNSAGRSGQ